MKKIEKFMLEKRAIFKGFFRADVAS